MSLAGWKSVDTVGITTDPTKVGSTLTDFPITVVLDSDDGPGEVVFSEAGDNYKCIAVENGDTGEQCYVEVEKWARVAPSQYVAVIQSHNKSNGDRLIENYGENTGPVMITGYQGFGGWNVYHSTSQWKFNNSSIYFNGSEDEGLIIGHSPAMVPGTSDFTIHYWVRRERTGVVESFVNIGGGSADKDTMLMMGVNNSNILSGYIGDGATSQYYGAGSLGSGQWYHIAIVKSGTTLRVCIGGSVVSTLTVASNFAPQNTDGISLGVSGGVSNEFNGFIDEFIWVNEALWTSFPFTPPTGPTNITRRMAKLSIKVPSISASVPTELTIYTDATKTNDAYVGINEEEFGERVINIGGEGTYDTVHACKSCIIKNSSNSFDMWYSGYDGTNWRIIYCNSTDGKTWSNHQLVIDVGESGLGEDSSHAQTPFVVKNSDTDHEMWYAGYDGSNYEIIYCTSSDGGITWGSFVKVLSVGASGTGYDAVGVYHPCVVKNAADDYELWYTGVDSSNDLRILYATSSDGQSWGSFSLAVNKGEEGTYDIDSVLAANVVKESASSYKMWYSGRVSDVNGNRDRIIYATSTNGTTWTNEQLCVDLYDNLFAVDMAFAPCVVKDGTEYRLWYSGSDGLNERILHGYLIDGYLARTPSSHVWSNSAAMVHRFTERREYHRPMVAGDPGTYSGYASNGSLSTAVGSYAADLRLVSRDTHALRIMINCSDVADVDWTRPAFIYITTSTDETDYAYVYDLVEDPARIRASLSSTYNEYVIPLHMFSVVGHHIDTTSSSVTLKTGLKTYCKNPGSYTMYIEYMYFVPFPMLYDSSPSRLHGFTKRSDQYSSGYGGLLGDYYRTRTNGVTLALLCDAYSTTPSYEQHEVIIPDKKGASDIIDTVTLETSVEIGSTLSDPIGNSVYFLDRHGLSPTADSYAFFFNTNAELQLGSNGGNIQGTTNSWAADTRFNLAGTYEVVAGPAYQGDLYVDGVKETLTTDNYDAMTSGDGGVIYINTPNDSYKTVDVLFYESLVSSAIRSDDWLLTREYDRVNTLISMKVTGLVSMVEAKYGISGEYVNWVNAIYSLRALYLIEQEYSIAHSATIVNELPYSIRDAIYITMLYGDNPVARALLTQYYHDAPVLKNVVRMLYEDALRYHSIIEMDYTIAQTLLSVFEAPFTITEEVATKLVEQGYDLSLYNKAVVKNEQPYTVFSGDTTIQPITSTVTIGGRSVEFSSFDLEFSLDSDAGSCSIQLAKYEDYATVVDLEDIVISINGDTYNFIVEGKSRSRRHNSATYSVDGVSEIVLLDTPYAKTITQEFTGDAETVINSLAGTLGPVDYQIAQFAILADTLSVVDQSPLSVIKTIKDAAHGRIQSDPDGGIRIVPWYQTSLPKWDTATIAVFLTDGVNFISQDDSPDKRPGYNKYLITDQSIPDDRMWVEQETISGTEKKLLGFKVPWEPEYNVRLLHSGGSWVPNAEYMGVVEETYPPLSEDPEQVEFVGGFANTSRPIYGDLDLNWIYEDIGPVTYYEEGKLEAADKTGRTYGYSLAEVRYTIRYHYWKAKDQRDENVQYILEVI